MVTLSSGSLKHLFYSLEAEWGAEDSHSNSVGRNAGLHLNLSFISSILAPLLWKMASPTHQKPTSSLQIVTKCSTEIKPKHTSMDGKNNSRTRYLRAPLCGILKIVEKQWKNVAPSTVNGLKSRWWGSRSDIRSAPGKTPNPKSLQSGFRSRPCAKGKDSI